MEYWKRVPGGGISRPSPLPPLLRLVHLKFIPPSRSYLPSTYVYSLPSWVFLKHARFNFLQGRENVPYSFRCGLCSPLSSPFICWNSLRLPLPTLVTGRRLGTSKRREAWLRQSQRVHPSSRALVRNTGEVQLHSAVRVCQPHGLLDGTHPSSTYGSIFPGSSTNKHYTVKKYSTSISTIDNLD